jgi:hypothetical protein
LLFVAADDGGGGRMIWIVFGWLVRVVAGWIVGIGIAVRRAQTLLSVCFEETKNEQY